MEYLFLAMYALVYIFGCWIIWRVGAVAIGARLQEYATNKRLLAAFFHGIAIALLGAISVIVLMTGLVALWFWIH